MEKELQLVEFFKQLEQFPGQYYLQQEREQLDVLVAHLYGYYLVQLGVVGSYALRASSTINHHIYVGRSTEATTDLCQVESHFSELPFQSESVDLFVLPHTLEFVTAPWKLLTEIYNILIPGGKLIIIGFNPFSIAGLIKLLNLTRSTLRIGKLYGAERVTGWLGAHGFTLEQEHTFCFCPPLKSQTVANKLLFLERIGARYLPFLGSVYMLLAEKKMAIIPSVKMKRYAQPLPVRSGFPEPSATGRVSRRSNNVIY